MKYQLRTVEPLIRQAARHFPSLLLTGPRRSGKTTLLRHCFPEADYILLEAADTVARAKSDPRGFLETPRKPVILDEIQNAPELFSYIRGMIDADPSRKGQWLITGSQEAALMQGVTESMAGRAAVFSLLPFSLEECSRITLLTGGFPEVLEAPEVGGLWFRSYVQTYLERDVRSLTAIRDLGTFRKFIALLASRCGQMLNKTDMAAPLGVSVPTVSQWLSILEVTGQILLVPPFHENFGKRLVKTPKVYFLDCGLACSLLGVRSPSDLTESPFRGPLFEGWVASEVLKHRLNRGLDRGLYYFRDKQGLEVDLVVDEGNRKLTLLDAKATRTPMPDDARSLSRLASAIKGYTCRSLLVHADGDGDPDSRPLRPGVVAVGLRGLHPLLD